VRGDSFGFEPSSSMTWAGGFAGKHAQALGFPGFALTRGR